MNAFLIHLVVTIHTEKDCQWQGVYCKEKECYAIHRAKNGNGTS